MKSSISFNELDKAIVSLEKALTYYQKTPSVDEEMQKAFRDACIQRFEYCIELSWKVSMKALGSTTLAAKPAIREMARNNLILNPELWMSFIEARNHSSHSYDEEVATKVFKAIEIFYKEVKVLLTNLKQMS